MGTLGLPRYRRLCRSEHDLLNAAFGLETLPQGGVPPLSLLGRRRVKQQPYTHCPYVTHSTTASRHNIITILGGQRDDSIPSRMSPRTARTPEGRWRHIQSRRTRKVAPHSAPLLPAWYVCTTALRAYPEAIMRRKWRAGTSSRPCRLAMRRKLRLTLLVKTRRTKILSDAVYPQDMKFNRSPLRRPRRCMSVARFLAN